jgi:hypothetical protein
MLENRCKFCTDGYHHCGSYQFNLHQRGISQGELCDVHYWEVRAAQLEEFAFKWCDIDHMEGKDLLFFSEIRKRVVADCDPTKPPF